MYGIYIYIIYTDIPMILYIIYITHNDIYAQYRTRIHVASSGDTYL